MTEAQAQFYRFVRASIQEHPDWISTANSAVQAGVEGALESANKARSDWEVVAANAMHTQLFKRNKLWLADVIERLQPAASMRWTDVIERLRK